MYDPAQFVRVYIYYHMLSHVLFCHSFSFLFFGVFSLDIFDTDFWSSCQPVSSEVT